MAHYHPTGDWLVSYASGSIDQASAVLIATHLTFCPDCRSAVAAYEFIGGVILDSVEIENSVETYFGKIPVLPNSRDLPRPTKVRASSATLSQSNEFAPQPLRQYIHDQIGVSNLDRLNWETYAPGIERVVLHEGPLGGLARIVRARPNAVFPHHDHGADELVVILKGALRDQNGLFRVGDVQCIGEGEAHQPTIEGDEICISFIVSEKPIIAAGS